MTRSGKEFRRHAAASWGAIVAVAAILLMAGCGGSLYKVKPVVEAPITGAVGTANAGGLSFSAVPLLADEESQELFEANLPLSGLLPVRVEINNESNEAVALERARFRLRDATGREWKPRTPRQAVSRILDANQITLYNPNARARFEEAFSAHALDTKRPLAPRERRRGMLFFQTPKKEAVESPRSLTLTIERLPQPVEIRLN
jgi:hypothetical protein